MRVYMKYKVSETQTESRTYETDNITMENGVILIDTENTDDIYKIENIIYLQIIK